MNLREYENDDDGMKAWLSEDEVTALLEQLEDTERRIAMELAVRCGLRSAEVVEFAPEDVADTDAGMMLRVWESAKTGEFRETPVPPNTATTIRAVGEVLRRGSTHVQHRVEIRHAGRDEALTECRVTNYLKPHRSGS